MPGLRKAGDRVSVVELPKGEGKVYFCCKNCPKAYAKDPAKFENKVRRQLAETGQIVQVACPISGQPVNKEVTVEHGHTKVGFCCKNCLAKYEAADDDGKLEGRIRQTRKGLHASNEVPGERQADQAGATVEHEGKKVYFCCPGCPEAFKADPAKYMAKLPQFAKARRSRNELRLAAIAAISSAGD